MCHRPSLWPPKNWIRHLSPQPEQLRKRFHPGLPHRPGNRSLLHVTLRDCRALAAPERQQQTVFSVVNGDSAGIKSPHITNNPTRGLSADSGREKISIFSADDGQISIIVRCFNTLRQGFVPFGQPFKALINRHGVHSHVQSL